MKQFLSFIAIIATTLCANNAIAKSSNNPKTCPAGFFCTQNGQYTNGYNSDGIASHMTAAAEFASPAGWGDWIEMGLCHCQGDPHACSYCIEDYDQVWVSTWFGFYTIKNGEVAYHASTDSNAPGAFPCPATHPSSAQGAQSVFDCYKMGPNRTAQYYQAPSTSNGSNSERGTSSPISNNNGSNNGRGTSTTNSNNNGSNNGRGTSTTTSNDSNDINTLLSNLQSALNQATKATQDLQRALNNTSTPSIILQNEQISVASQPTLNKKTAITAPRQATMPQKPSAIHRATK